MAAIQATFPLGRRIYTHPPRESIQSTAEKIGLGLRYWRLLLPVVDLDDFTFARKLAVAEGAERSTIQPTRPILLFFFYCLSPKGRSFLFNNKKKVEKSADSRSIARVLDVTYLAHSDE